VKSIIKFISASRETLPKIPISNGQLIFVPDNKQIALDFNNNRTIYEELQILQTEEERTSLSHPISAFYFVLETAILYRYTNQWIQITWPPEDIVIYKTSYLQFPTVGNENRIYIDKTNNASFRWSDTDLKYYCVGRDYTEISTIDANF